MTGQENGISRVESLHGYFLKFAAKLMEFVSVRKANFYSGIIMAIGGISSIAYSIRPTPGFDQVYYYWSFTYVKPYHLSQGTGTYFIPALVHTYEVLLPWLIIGLAASILGMYLIIKRPGVLN